MAGPAADGAQDAAAILPAAPSSPRSKTTWEHKGKMLNHGLHVWDEGWSTYHSSSMFECTLKCLATGETLELPVQTCTKVGDVRHAIANMCMLEVHSISLVAKRGCTWAKLQDDTTVVRHISVKGTRGFKPEVARWEHPNVIIGAGYGGIKAALMHRTDGSNSDFVIFERHERVGGTAWLIQANKTSKLQTDLAAFHVWFGPEWDESNKILSFPTDWSSFPKKDETIAHMQYAAERYDILPQICFRTELSEVEVVYRNPNGRNTYQDQDRHYTLVASPVGDATKQPYSVTTNNIFHFPGAYCNARIIDYPGEELFAGKIGYGMADDLPFDNLAYKRTAILGNGAFAVENIRTCVEYGAEKVYLVTRRRNLPCPRLCCWFVHQSILPVPASFLLNTFDPMFSQCGFGDPWDYHSVYASKDHRHCTIASNSRFGIGDVTFLAVATGRCEYVVDTVKRVTANTLHLNGGGKIDNIQNIIKALGLLADYGADKMHKIKDMIGMFPNGDSRRMVFSDPLGMNAANFSSMSAGSGTYVSVTQIKYFMDHPKEGQKLYDQNIISLLPKMTKSENHPIHQMDAKHVSVVAMFMLGAFPKCASKLDMDGYFHKVVTACYPLDKYFAECVNSWNQYQRDFAAQGYNHPYVPYPYTLDMVHSWFDEYEKTVGPTSLDAREEWLREVVKKGHQASYGTGDQHKAWWAETDQALAVKGIV